MNGLQVKEIRDRLNISREEFARRLGISFFTVLRWEKGKRNPSPMAQKLLEDFVRENEKTK